MQSALATTKAGNSDGEYIVINVLSKISDYALPIKTLPTAKVLHIKQEISKKWGIGLQQQHLAFQGNQLEEQHELQALGISDGSDVYLTLSSKDTLSKETLGDDIILSIVGLDERDTVLTVPRAMTVAELKKTYCNKLESKATGPAIEFIYMDTLLNNDWTLSDHCIGFGTTTKLFGAFGDAATATKKRLPAAKQSDLIVPAFSKSCSLSQNCAIRIFSQDLQMSMVVSTENTIKLEKLKEIYLSCLGSHETSSRLDGWKNVALAAEVRFKIASLKADNFSFKYGKQILNDTKQLSSIVGDWEKVWTLSIVINEEYQNSLTRTAAEFKAVSKDSAFIEAFNSARSALAQRSVDAKSRIQHYHKLDLLRTEQTSKDMKAATSFTAEILGKKPCGNLGSDPLLVAHILSGMCRQNNEEAVFYDSRKGMQLQESCASIDHLMLGDKSMVLRLESLEGLFGVPSGIKVSGREEDKKVAEIQAAIQLGKVHPILTGIKASLSKCLEVDSSRIEIRQVYKGSVCFEFTVNDLSMRERQTILQQDTSGRLRQEFSCFLELLIHPLLFRPAFDFAMFDIRGHKSFVNEGSEHQVGPAGQKKTYTQPRGWMRYGLRVRTEDARVDKWLHPFKDPSNWWRAYHGTARAGRYMSGINSTDPAQMANAAVDAMAGIYQNGFNAAHAARYGSGVYCSPDPVWLNNSSYVPKVPVWIQGQSQPKNFKCMLQVAVKPGLDTLQRASTATIWAVKKPEDIRPYGILIKTA